MRSRAATNPFFDKLILQRQPTLQSLLLLLLLVTYALTTTSSFGVVEGFASFTTFPKRISSLSRILPQRQQELRRGQQQQHQLHQKQLSIGVVHTTDKTTTSSSTATTTCLFSLSSNFIDPKDDSNTSEEDLSRWERMYVEGEVADMARKLGAAAGGDVVVDDKIDAAALQSTTPIRVISFDLDNCLWKTDACIDGANNALAQYLQENGNIQQPERVEHIMKRLFQTSPITTYCPLAKSVPSSSPDDGVTTDAINGDSSAKGGASGSNNPVLLTKLRIDSIQELLVKYNDYTIEDAQIYAQKAFDYWTMERHNNIPQNLANNVVETLQALKSTISVPSSSSSSPTRRQGEHPVIIGAITDGNSDPRRVQELKEYFDFVVNAEEVGVAKPDKRVYFEAFRRVISQHPSLFKDVTKGVAVDGYENESDNIEEMIGPYWVHIGDDFVKDVVAAKTLGMRSIWATELIQEKLQKQQRQKEQAEITNSEKTKKKNVEEFVQEVSEMKVIEMPVGADNYLADSIQREFVDAVVDDFADLVSTLSEWHEEGKRTVGLQQQPSDAGFREAETSEIIGSSSPNNEDNPLSVVLPDFKVNVQSEAVSGMISSSNINGKTPPSITTSQSRVFRLVRDDCKMDIPAPLLDRDTRKMKDVLEMAQRDKSSGVFSFPMDEIQALREGSLVLMIDVVDADIRFSREIFVGMTVEEVLALTNQNPLTLSLSMKKAAADTGFDLF